MKLVSHGRKINKMGVPHGHIQAVVELSSLFGLVDVSYDTTNKRLLSTFVDKWHADTNTFHLSIEELTITLDDLSNLLHLPIIRKFYTYPNLYVVVAMDLLVQSLCVDCGATIAETRHCQGGNMRLNWLREVYEDVCNNKQWTVAARAYLLHLVSCIIFVDKNVTLVRLSYMRFFVDLRHTEGYSWVTTALIHMYKHLGYTSYANMGS